MSYQDILNLMNTKCGHFTYNSYNNYWSGRNEMKTCDGICNRISGIINDTNCQIPTEQFVSEFISYMFMGHRTSSYTYYSTCMTSDNSAQIIQVMKNLLILQNPTTTGLKILTEKNMHEMLLIIQEKQTRLLFSDYNNLIKLTTNHLVLAYLNKMLKPEDYSKAMMLYITNGAYLPFINNLLNDGYIPTQNEFDILHKLTPKATQYLDIFQTYGMYYNTQCLENACLSGDIVSIKKILDARVTPTSICFSNIVSGIHFDRTNLVEMLIYYNYVVTYEDVILAITKTFELIDLDRFNIKLDTKALELCYSYNFHPKNYNFEGVDASLRILQETVTKGANVLEIKKIIKQYNMVPDKITMENACNFSRNKPVITGLIDAGGIITSKCIYNCGLHLSRNDTLVYIVTEFMQHEKKNEDKILALEKELKELKELMCATTNIATESINDKTEMNVQTVYSKGSCDEDKDEEDDEDKDEEDDENDTLDTDIAFDGKNIISKKMVVSTGSSEDIIKISQIIVPTGIKIPTNKRNKLNPPCILVKFFALDKSIKMSYIEVRKYLRNIIQEKNWIAKDNKGLIDFPPAFRKVLGIDMDGFIQHSDLDRIVSLCYK